MALVLLEFLGIATLSLVWGLGVQRFLVVPASEDVWPAWLVVLIGFVVFPTVLAALSLAMPISPIVLAGVFPLTGLIAWFLRSDLRLFSRSLVQTVKATTWAEGLFLAAMMGVGLMKGAALSSLFDDGYYYMPFVKWTQLQGAVPGLGNLHHRLAFNSHYHLWTALFSDPWVRNIPLNDTGEFLLILLSLALVTEIRENPFPSIRWVAGLMLIANWVQVRYRLTCPEADTALLFICEALGLLLCRLWVSDKSPRVWLTAAALLIGTVITFKLSAIALALGIVAILVYLLRSQQKALAFRLLGVLAPIALFWMARNVILSGYLAFPISALPPVVSEWAIPKEIILDEERLIFLYAKVNLKAFSFSPQELAQVKWYSHWEHYKWLWSLGWLAIVGGLALLFVPVFGRKNLSPWQKSLVWTFWGGLLLATLVWLVKAPGLRFHQGPFLLAGVLGLVLLTHRLAPARWGMSYAYVVLALVFLFVGRDMSSIRQYALRPAPWLIAPEYDSFTNSYGTKLVIPTLSWEIDRWVRIPNAELPCWNGPEPCTHRKFDNLVLREPGHIQAGFRFDGPPRMDGKPFIPR